MRILITGIAGFVGSSVARTFLADMPGIDIVGVDNLSFGYKKRLDDLIDRIQFVEMDVRDVDGLVALGDFDLIIHCAAIAPLPDNQVNPFHSLEQNVAICGSVVDFATRAGVKNIIFFSSGAIYEGSGLRPCVETDAITTKLVYPTTKYLAEQFFESMATTYGLNVVALRLFNLYGPQQDYFRKQPPLLGYLLKSLIQGDDVTIYASKEARRDYIFIDDLAALLMQIMSRFDNDSEGSFVAVNAGSGYTYSVYDIIETLNQVSGKTLNYQVGEASGFWGKYPGIFERAMPLPTEYVSAEINKIAIANIDKARTLFDWEPKVAMAEGIQHCLEFAMKEIQ